MKCVLYAAVSVDGFIARFDDSTSWSSAAWDSYYEIAKHFKAIVFGEGVRLFSGEFFSKLSLIGSKKLDGTVQLCYALK